MFGALIDITADVKPDYTNRNVTVEFSHTTGNLVISTERARLFVERLLAVAKMVEDHK